MSDETEQDLARAEAEALRQRVALRQADKVVKDAEAKRRYRRIVRLEVAAFLLSAMFVAGLLYYKNTTRVAEDFFGLQFRFGKIVAISQGGDHIYRVPILDHIVLIDKGTRPLPALRRSAKSASGTSIPYEALLNFSVSDPEKYWNQFHGNDAEGAQLVVKTAEAACAAVIAQNDDKQLVAADTPAQLGKAATVAMNEKLAPSGLAVSDLRFVSLRLQP